MSEAGLWEPGVAGSSPAFPTNGHVADVVYARR